MERYLKKVILHDLNKKIVLITGSAKIETYKKMGDSLAGRYYQYRLFPLDVKEIVKNSKMKSATAMDTKVVSAAEWLAEMKW